MTVIENQSFDEERALYNSNGVIVKNCLFDGPLYGESAFKESTDIVSEKCLFNLRYPFWHTNGVNIKSCTLTSNCRAALWYSSDIKIFDTKLHGIKALRECRNAEIADCDISSPEFGWFCSNISMQNCKAESEYFMLKCGHLSFKNTTLKGKYSFQYCDNATFDNCSFDTKDAFWHSKNTVVCNSVLKGEYLGWYSDGLVLENCKIIGTQPLCYCKNLTLINCEMTDCDLAFEKSAVNAKIKSHIDSIKNPLSGTIHAESIGKIIMDTDAPCVTIIEGGDQK